ncbi:Phenylacetic acid catabolic protein [Ferviditalea candida]|uniref:Phenylacetic acid catabolic protein n=1 Tax=Ferviditalea candida TaxID=3108399 RepID=A0ABU5ZCB0_9BACL|nr:Phenylacetic acid catabolic protein [Paenibacillaceae bacterium T2]
MNEISAGLQAFIEIIQQIADNKYVLGDRLVEIGISGPNLEATLASIAMAQGELGHARLLYNWAFDLQGLEGKKPEIEDQTGRAFSSVVSIDNWFDLITSVYAVNEALELVLQDILEANHSEVAHRIHKLLKEQKEHIIYSRNWVRQLLKDKGAIPHKCNEGLEKAIPDALNWLNKIEQDSALIAEGYRLADRNLVKRFQGRIDQLREEMDVSHVV